MINTEHFQPGTSLANAIGEDFSPMNVGEMRSHTDSERQSLNDLENMKYKTELCRNYSAYGYCSYASRCQFAHGFDELRCRTRHPKYKTEFCRNFLSGFCKYGTRCQFLHHSTNTNLPLESNPTAAALGTYLLLVHSASLGLGESQSALNATATESSLKRPIVPFSCASELHRHIPLHLSPHPSHGFSTSHYQNNNNSPSNRTTSRESSRIEISHEEKQ